MHKSSKLSHSCSLICDELSCSGQNCPAADPRYCACPFHLPENELPIKKIQYMANTYRKLRIECNVCKSTFSNTTAFRVHYGIIHLKTEYRCGKNGCYKVFATIRQLKNHKICQPLPRSYSVVIISMRNAQGAIQKIWMDGTRTANGIEIDW